MLSPDADQRKAIRYFEYHTAEGLDMSAWKILRSHPTKVSPANLVLLSQHTGDEIGTLFSHGIGIDNRVCDLFNHIDIDARGVMTIKDRSTAVAA